MMRLACSDAAEAECPKIPRVRLANFVLSFRSLFDVDGEAGACRRAFNKTMILVVLYRYPFRPMVGGGLDDKIREVVQVAENGRNIL